MGGPVFGVSGQLNLAYYDALKAMSSMCCISGTKDGFTDRAEKLRKAIVKHLWCENTGILKMSGNSPEDGLCQNTNAYSISLGISPVHTEDETLLECRDGDLPLAFQRLERWDKMKVVSPYTTGFAVEACFERGFGHSAVDLIRRVWGLMADQDNPNYSGGHWETLTADGKPFHKDTSLMHGWSTWPVHLLPRYLAGVHPVEAGWKRWAVKPVLAGLDSVEVVLDTVAGSIEVSLRIQELEGTGTINITVPVNTEAEVFAPKGWELDDNTSSRVVTSGAQRVEIRLQKCPTPRTSDSETSRSSMATMHDGRVEDKQVSVVVTSTDQTWVSKQFNLLRSAWTWLASVLRSVTL